MSTTESSIETVISRLDELVAFDSVSSKSNRALVDHIRHTIAGLGLACDVIANPDGSKQGLIISTQPNVSGQGIILSAHTDVVPTAGQPWSSDPFKLRRDAGRLYGRGTADMKGFIAVVLALLPELTARGGRAPPAHLVLSFDEELGCAGMPFMLPAIKQRLSGARGCIVGEPTRLATVLGHKGKQSWRATIAGRAAHSASPQEGLNAISLAAKLIAAIDECAQEKVRAGPYDAAFRLPVSTMQVGLVSGGTALNIVPETGSLDFEIRNIPSEPIPPILDSILATFDAALSAMDPALSRDNVLRLEKLAEYPGLTSREDSSFVLAANAALAEGCDVQTVSFGTEAGFFADLGIPTIVWGPGSMSQGHKPDEFIEIEQLELCLARLRAFLCA